jgi:3-methyl-2-oxobutanoate hydroxymethyltransferase
MTYPTVSSDSPTKKAMSLPRLLEMHAKGEKIAVLTGYDASFASLLERCGVDVILVGDSLGMVLQGHRSTLPVTIEQMIYHTACVARGAPSTWIVADMPFGSYQESCEAAYANAARLVREGAQMVKVEGGSWLAPTIEYLTTRSIPVCAHLGLTPQSVHALGGYRVQGKTDATAARLKADAQAVAAAGAQMLVFEMVPAPLASEITQALAIPTIGIGAGAGCSGQVLVLHDMLGVFPGKAARFVKNFMTGNATIEAAICAYVAEVRGGTFPAAEHTY